jgi:hypothetical protein
VSAGDWVALAVAVAGVIAALTGFAAPERRRPLIKTCIILIFVAIAVGAISTIRKQDDRVSGSTVTTSTPTTGGAANPVPSPAPPGSNLKSPQLWTPAPATPIIRRETGNNPIRLTGRSAVDLDSMSPNWDVQSFSTGTPGLDLARRPGSADIVQSDFGVYDYPVSGPPSLDACKTATARYDRINLKDVTEFCLVTSEGRYAFVKVMDAGIGDDPSVFDVIVWEK